MSPVTFDLQRKKVRQAVKPLPRGLETIMDDTYNNYDAYRPTENPATAEPANTAQDTSQTDAYAQYAYGYGYVPGGGPQTQRTYTGASVIPDAPKKIKKQHRMPTS